MKIMLPNKVMTNNKLHKNLLKNQLINNNLNHQHHLKRPEARPQHKNPLPAHKLPPNLTKKVSEKHPPKNLIKNPLPEPGHLKNLRKRPVEKLPLKNLQPKIHLLKNSPQKNLLIKNQVFKNNQFRNQPKIQLQNTDLNNTIFKY